MATQIADRTTAERVSRLEGAYEHLATKADIARLEGEIHRVEGRIVRWMVTVTLISATAGAAIVTALNSLLTVG